MLKPIQGTAASKLISFPSTRLPASLPALHEPPAQQAAPRRRRGCRPRASPVQLCARSGWAPPPWPAARWPRSAASPAVCPTAGAVVGGCKVGCTGDASRPLLSRSTLATAAASSQQPAAASSSQQPAAAASSSQQPAAASSSQHTTLVPTPGPHPPAPLRQPHQQQPKSIEAKQRPTRATNTSGCCSC